MSKRNVWLIGAGTVAVLAFLWWRSNQAKATTAAGTPLIVGEGGITPLIDDLSNGEPYATTAKAIV